MIFFFSGTGNSQWAARRLAEATGEKLIAMTGQDAADSRYELSAGERVGFCFPVHGWQPPAIVRQFVSRLQLNVESSSRPFVYAVMTCGDSIGMAMEIFAKDLEQNGMTLDSAFTLVMPESYVCLPFMKTDPPERERQKTERAKDDLSRYLPLIVGRERSRFHVVKGMAPWLLSHVVGEYFNRHMISDRKFRVNADVCLHCSRCSTVCPTGDLFMAPGDAPDGKAVPHWRGDGSCTCCLACYHHCPVHAIDYGRYTPRRGQYYYGHDCKPSAE